MAQALEGMTGFQVLDNSGAVVGGYSWNDPSSYTVNSLQGDIASHFPTLLQSNSSLMTTAKSLLGANMTNAGMNPGTATPGTSSAGATSQPGATVTSASTGSFASGLNAYFIRGTVMILGLIFVAVGLRMFNVPGVSPLVDKVHAKIRTPKAA